MARTGPKNSALRVLVWLGVILAVMTAVLAGGTMAGQASWAPKLALDLEGGTQMILAPKVEGGSDINEEQLNQAVAIIRQRVDGSGVAEAEISTQSGRNVVVSLPGTPSKENNRSQAPDSSAARPSSPVTSTNEMRKRESCRSVLKSRPK